MEQTGGWLFAVVFYLKQMLIFSPNFVQDDTTNTPTNLSENYSDLIEFENDLYATLATDIAKLPNASTWDVDWWTTVADSGQSALTNNTPHPLCVGFNNLMIIGDANYIHTLDSSGAVQYKLVTLADEFEIVWIKASSNSYWIGARNKRGRNGQVFEWDGASTVVNFAFDIKGEIPYSCVIKNGIPFVMNSNGQLLAFNGGGFIEIARLPVLENPRFRVDLSGTSYNIGWNDGNNPRQCIHRNGMAVIDDKIHILLNGAIGNAKYLLENMKSGIWIFDENIGLHHKYSLSVGATVDYGVAVTNKVGALTAINEKQNGSFLVGAQIYKNATPSYMHAIWRGGTINANEIRSAFITPFLKSFALEDVWQSIALIFNKFVTSGTDAIVMKYRTQKEDNFPYYITLTWVNATSFTTTSTNFDTYAKVGDEVEILFGIGAGCLAHITSITDNAGTFTVSLDEDIDGGVTGTAGAIIQNWRKITTLTDNNSKKEIISIQDDYTRKMSTQDTNIQFKVELRGTLQSPVLEELRVKHSASTIE